METDNTKEFISNFYKLSEVQQFLADSVLQLLYYNYPDYALIRPHGLRIKIEKEHKMELSDSDIFHTLEKLELHFSFIEKYSESEKYRLTLIGKETIDEHNNFISFLCADLNNRLNEVQEVEKSKLTKNMIDNLTIRQLEGSIFQVKYWWFVLIINAIVSFLVVYLTNLLS